MSRVSDELERLIGRPPRDPVEAAKSDAAAVFREHRKALRAAIRAALAPETQARAPIGER